MGNVSSRPDEPSAIFLRDPSRLTIAHLQILNSRKKQLFNIVPNSYPCSRAIVKKDLGDDGLVEYVQDPDPTGPGILLKVTNEDELFFNFTFNVRQLEGADTTINGLTFVVANNKRELDNLVIREFHADPNLHKHPNVELVGDIATEGSPAVSFTYSWKWKPPHGAEEKNGGYRNSCCFVEYDQRAHKLSTLAEFSVWVQSSNKSPVLLSPGATLDPRMIPRSRLSSSYSLDSRVTEQFPDNLSEPKTPGADAATFELGSPTSMPPQPPPVKVDVNCHKVQDDNMGDDGPLFRATMKSLESRTSTLRQKMKKVLKRAQEAKTAQVASNDALQAFTDALRDAAMTNASGIKPAVEHYFERAAKDIFQYERLNETNLQKLIIDPMHKIYNLDIKQAEGKKKDFDDESRDYYAYVSRYLGMRSDSVNQKKKSDSDTKYQTKRRNFELKRFEYSNFMQDLHGGRKEQELLSHLTKYADAQAKMYLATSKKIQDQLNHLDALSYEVKEIDKDYDMQRIEREERRRALEKSTATYNEPDIVASLVTAPVIPSSQASMIAENGVSSSDAGKDSIRQTVSSSSGLSSGISDATLAMVAPTMASMSTTTVQSLGAPTREPSNKFKGIRDLEEKDFNANGIPADRKKEGLLWALSRPGSHADPKGLNKQAWHKYWVVLAGGQLCEYSNWKQKLDLHNDPINLKMASVREARSSERRFCFEVITPQYKRVYQATSEDDMNNWIASIDNAVKGTLEGAGSTLAFDASKLDYDSSSKDISSVFSSNRSHIPGMSQLSSSASNNLHRRITVGARPGFHRLSSTFGGDPEKLLQMVREADPANSSCADCRSQTKTDWVSINLGIILCIECSGIHRSLGTHISKIRSLTLDVHSFTPDLTDLLLKIGNTASNKIWEARLEPTQRLTEQSTRDTRLKFITAKYAERSFVQQISSTLSAHSSPDATLMAAAKRNDLAKAIYAIALKANPNTVDPTTNVPVVLISLASADPFPTSPPPRAETPTGTKDSTATTATTTTTSPSTTFPIAELLLQNGGYVPTTTTASYAAVQSQLSASAKSYLALKREKNGYTDTEHRPRQKELLSPSATGSGSSSDTNTGGGGSSGGLQQVRSGGSISSSSGGGVGGKERGDRGDRDGREEKLRKRVSSGGRLPRPSGLDPRQ